MSREMQAPAGHLTDTPKEPRSSSSGGLCSRPRIPRCVPPSCDVGPFFAGSPRARAPRGAVASTPSAAVLLRRPGGQGAVVQVSALEPRQEGLFLGARVGVYSPPSWFLLCEDLSSHRFLRNGFLSGDGLIHQILIL